MTHYNKYEADVVSKNQESEYYFEAVRLALGDKEGILSEEHIKLILQEAEAQLSPEEMEILEGFFSKIGKGLKKFGKGVVRIGKKALPVVGKIAQIAAPVVGTVFGGPAGAMLGSKIGNIVGKVTQIGKATKGLGALFGGGRPPQPAFIQRPQFQPQPQRIPHNTALNGNQQLLQRSQPAANQLLGLLQNPALLQSLLGQVLGGRSQGTVRMATPNQGGASNIPFGAFMNLLGQLSTQAAIEANGHIEDEPTYLYDSQGEFAIEDPASNEARAEHLLQILQENTFDNYSLPEARRKQDSMTEWFVKSGLIH